MNYAKEKFMDLWTANTVVQLRMLGIKQKDFAEMCGYSEPYLSMDSLKLMIG